ncbi:MAG: tetratricopeptide repeat protein [Verrucomicrobiota bacterium]
MTSKRSVPIAVWLFLLVFALRLLVVMRLADSPYLLASSGDMKFYSDWALRIAKGHFTDHRAFYGLPGYPFLLGAIFFVVGFDPFAVGLLQAASEAGIAVLIFKIAQCVCPGNRGKVVGALAALGWTFYQPTQAFSAILMPTTWLVLAFWGIAWWSLRTRSESVWRPWLAVGLITGLVATMVATIFFVLPLPIAAVVRNLRRPIAILTAVASMLLGVILGASPCWIHNYFIAGEPVFLSAHSGINFWIGNNPVATGYPKIPPDLRASQEGMLKDSIRLAEVAAGHPLRRAEVSRYWSQKADVYIHEHPREWALLMLTKVRNLWNAYQYDDLSIVTPLSEDGILTPGIRFGFVAVLAIPGMLLAWRRYGASRWITTAVLLHLAALLPVFVTERYRLAAVPGLLLLGALGLVDLWEAFTYRLWTRSGAYLAVGVAGLLFVTIPQQNATLWSLDAYNTGLKDLESGNQERARKKLELALAYSPNNAEVNFCLGNYWLKKEDQSRAKHFYLRAIDLDPDSVGALNNLAVLAIVDSNWAAAKAFLGRTLKLESDDPKTYYLLAYCEYSAGNREGALQQIRRALALRPQQPEFLAFLEKVQAGKSLDPVKVNQ